MLPKKSNKFILVLILCAIVFVSAFALNTSGTRSLLGAEPTWVGIYQSFYFSFITLNKNHSKKAALYRRFF